MTTCTSEKPDCNAREHTTKLAEMIVVQRIDSESAYIDSTYKCVNCGIEFTFRMRNDH